MSIKNSESRALRDEEKAVIIALLGSTQNELIWNIDTVLVEDMNDGGMGSVCFMPLSGKIQRFGKVVGEAEYLDEDNVPVSILVNVDDENQLYELDFWKVDFSSLIQYPQPEQLKVKP